VAGGLDTSPGQHTHTNPLNGFVCVT